MNTNRAPFPTPRFSVIVMPVSARARRDPAGILCRTRARKSVSCQQQEPRLVPLRQQTPHLSTSCTDMRTDDIASVSDTLAQCTMAFLRGIRMFRTRQAFPQVPVIVTPFNETRSLHTPNHRCKQFQLQGVRSEILVVLGKLELQQIFSRADPIFPSIISSADLQHHLQQFRYNRQLHKLVEHIMHHITFRG